MHMQSSSYRFDLICHLVWRDFVLSYKRSVLGVLWSLMSPLTQLLVLVFLFGRLIPLRIEAYPAFVFSGLLPWVWFSTCLQSAGGLFVNNRDLVRRPNFEPATLVTVNTLSNLIHYLIFLPVLFFVLLLYGRSLSIFVCFLPILLIIQGVLIVGLSLTIATLNVFYRDVEQMVGLGVMLLFYLTPVFYQQNVVSEKYRVLFLLNPMAVLVQGYREILFNARPPEWAPLLLASTISVALGGLGYLVYSRQLSNVFDAL
jgi:lipopolysaccharide transport system permease protein